MLRSEPLQITPVSAALPRKMRESHQLEGRSVGPGSSGAFLRRAEALAEGNPVLAPLVTCLNEVRRHVAAQISALDREIGRIVRNDTTLRRFVTVPGVGPITALAFVSTIDDPSRFRRARDVSPYPSLTPRRHQ